MRHQRDLVRDSRCRPGRPGGEKSFPSERDDVPEKDEDCMEDVDLGPEGGSEPETVISPLQDCD